MARDLSSRIADHLKSRPAIAGRRSGKTRAAVLALRSDIEGALEDKFEVKEIWETLKHEGSIEVGYHAFLRAVRGLGLQPRPKNATASPGSLQPKSARAGTTTPAQAPRKPATTDVRLEDVRVREYGDPEEEGLF